MKRQQPSRARLRTSFRSWAAFAAIFLIAQFFAVAAPLGGQNPPSSVPDSLLPCNEDWTPRLTINLP